MFNNIDLRELAAVSGPERAFVSLYLTTPDSYATLKPRIEKIRALLADNPEELEHFEENLKLIDPWLAEHRWETEGVCLFVCWALDYVRSPAPRRTSWTRSRRCPRPARWRRSCGTERTQRTAGTARTKDPAVLAVL